MATRAREKPGAAPDRRLEDAPAALAYDAPGDIGLLRASQKKWVADKADVKIAEKGRRTGFTFGEAADDVLIAASAREAGGDNVYYIGTTLDMAREYIDACGRWAVGLNYAAGEIGEVLIDEVDETTGTTRHIKSFRIDFPSGFFILALSSRPRSLRGRQGVVVIDEAAFQDDLDGLLTAALALIILGSKVRIISTHNGVENPFNQLIEECRARRLPYSVHKCTFDDAVKEGLYRTRCKAKGEKWTPEGEAKFTADVRAFYRGRDEQELDCIPALSGGTYLPLTLILPCVNKAIPVVRWSFKAEFLDLPLAVRNADAEAKCRDELLPIIAAMDKAAPSYFGGDFGRSANRTTLWPAQRLRDNSLRTPFVLELLNCPFEQHETIFLWIVRRLPNFSHGKQDARGNGQALAEKLRTTFGATRIEEVKATREWYSVNWPPAKARLEDRTVDVPNDSEIHDDLRAVKVVKGVPVIPDQKAGTTDAALRHGDAAIAFLNLCAAATAAAWSSGEEYQGAANDTGYLEPKAHDRGRLKLRAPEDDDDMAPAAPTTW